MTLLTLGEVIRSLRTEKGMTLKQVAEKANLSVAMISKIERGNSDPSISSLRSIAHALNVPTAFLLTGQDLVEQALIRHNQVTIFDHEGAITEVVTAPSSVTARFIYVRAEPGAERGTRLFPHDPHDGYEQGRVVRGVMELTINGEVYTLEPGDTIGFPSRLPHSWRNPGTEVLEVAWVLSKDLNER